MLFNSLKFLWFFPVVFVLHWALPHRARKYLLLLASYYFYMCWKPEFIVLIVFSTAVDYFCSLGMERFDGNEKRRKALLAVSLTMNLGLLFFFKYFNFFSSSLTALCRAVSIPFSAPMLDIILPVGISFYTFQTLGYTIDVYRGELEPEHDFVTFALFVSYFPQLVAGPIERAEKLLPQLKKERTFSYDDAVRGLRLTVWGFFKKCVASAYLALIVDPVYNNIAEANGGAVALATVAFALQIYCDFGGYSDIARGCSRMMGVELMENFKRPYLAQSVRDFWSRWHISLTGWFNDYVFFPLCFSPLGRKWNAGARMGLATLITFFLSGLWHGASWTFVTWGVLGGVMLMGESVLRFGRGGDALERWPVWLKIAMTLLLSCFTVVFFRANSMADALTALRLVFTDLRSPTAWLLGALSALLVDGEWAALFAVFSVAVLFVYDGIDERTEVVTAVERLRWYVRWPLYFAFLLLLVVLMPKATPAPFIYFQF